VWTRCQQRSRLTGFQADIKTIQRHGQTAAHSFNIGLFTRPALEKCFFLRVFWQALQLLNFMRRKKTAGNLQVSQVFAHKFDIDPNRAHLCDGYHSHSMRMR
jgi:hypothetical protein